MQTSKQTMRQFHRKVREHARQTQRAKHATEADRIQIAAELIVRYVADLRGAAAA